MARNIKSGALALLLAGGCAMVWLGDNPAEFLREARFEGCG